MHNRPVGAEGAMAPPDFYRSVNPYLNKGGQIMPTTLRLAPPDFQTFLRPWVGVGWHWGVKGHLMVFSSFTSAHTIKDLFKKMHKPPFPFSLLR